MTEKSQQNKILTDESLLQTIRSRAKTEQQLTLEVIELIQEVMRRQLYLQLGFGSLFDFVTKDLGYEPASAMRRISAARLIQQIPEVKTKIQNGSLKLTVVAQAQSFFKKEEAATGNRLKPEQKKQILQNLENKSSREAELELVKLRPESLKHSERLRPLTEEFTEIKFVITSDLKNKITELQNLLSHQLPDKNISSLMQLLVEKLYNDFKLKGKIAEINSEITNNPTFSCAGVKNSSRIEHATVNKKSDNKVNQIACFDLVPQIKYKPTNSGAGVEKSTSYKNLNYPVVKYSQGHNPIQSSRKIREKKESVIPASKTLQSNHQNEFAERASKNLKLNFSTNTYTSTSTSTSSEYESNTTTISNAKTCANINTSTKGGLTRNQSPSRYIAAQVQKFIWRRDQGSCQYQNTITGKKCESKHQLQIDHIHRFADGGSHKPENLRLLCRAHNNWRG
jgi:hypothetical protein